MVPSYDLVLKDWWGRLKVRVAEIVGTAYTTDSFSIEIQHFWG